MKGEVAVLGSGFAWFAGLWGPIAFLSSKKFRNYLIICCDGRGQSLSQYNISIPNK